MYLSKCDHQPRVGAAGVDVVLEVSSSSRARGIVQVAGQQVVERRDVGRALDRGVAAQRHDRRRRAGRCCRAAAAGSRAARMICDAGGVLGPADGVDRTRSCARGPEFSISASATSQEVLRRDAADLLDHLRRVAREVALEDLEDAARVLQRRRRARPAPVEHAGAGVLARTPASSARAARRPTRSRRPRTSSVDAVVGAGLGVEAGEDAAEVLGVLEVLVDRASRRWCSARRTPRSSDSVSITWLIRPPRKAMSVPGADRHVDVGQRARAREARVDVDDLRAALLAPSSPSGSRPGAPRPWRSP